MAHMMLEAMTALLSLPRVISHKFNKSRMTVTRNLRQGLKVQILQQYTHVLCHLLQISQSGAMSIC